MSIDEAKSSLAVKLMQVRFIYFSSSANLGYSFFFLVDGKLIWDIVHRP